MSSLIADDRTAVEWVRPWTDAEQLEYERLVEREISALRSRNRMFRLQSMITMR